jgi:hypothetical protein
VESSAVSFAHESEAAVARLFDFYRIAWEYEPRSFPIAWNQRGQAVAFFTPDFYLPDFDVYIEVTAAKPEHNSRKHRKVRLMRALHPEVRIKLLLRRDLERLFSRMRAAA